MSRTNNFFAVQGLFLQGAGMSAAGGILQRKSNVQLKPGIEAFPVTLHPKSGGIPLPKDVLSKMEGALGASFSDVRVHVGSEAASIGAIAFTWGSDIHFAPGQYNPHTPHGQFLLGHELTHVVQQRAGRVSNPFGAGVAVVQDHALEAEADRMGRLIAMGPANISGASASGGVNAPGVAVGTEAILRKAAPPPSYAVRPAIRQGSGWEIRASALGKPDAVGSVRLTPSGQNMHISDLTVAPEHRRHGLGKQLVQAAVRTARNQGYAVARLEARPSSGASVTPASLVAMYQKLGFRRTGHSHRGNPLMERRT
jgi:GNAT superfamily N-acetyltransferase